MKPDVLIIGDSHAKALQQGCETIGIRTLHAGFSGRNWHQGNIVYHKKTGLWMRRAWAQKKFSDMREELGTETLVEPGIPVLFSVGFHLGRLVPPFGWNGHTLLSEHAAATEDRMIVSQAFLEDYIDAYRSAHFKLIRQFARQTALTVVAPPHSFERENYAAFRDIISDKIRACGASLYDPKDDLTDNTGLLPDTLLEADGIHGNAEYGRRIIEILLDRGLLKLDHPKLIDRTGRG